ncbi:MAG TPA: rRNA maturation RNase YbeY [Dongiaceae bacterium]|jgi:probable rRNA maturation factor|nr:rRNA maturation RNase YbeY [Dongiaceae bacterium]
MPRAAPIRAAVAVIVDDRGWQKLVGDPEPLLRRAARAALAVARRPRGLKPGGTAALSVALMGDRGVKRLNREFRGKDRPTNVLSFPAAMVPGRAAKARVDLGDVALALGVVRREAKAQGKSPADHLAHLMVHGVLHLLGYDHETDRDAERMERLERRALAALGIADPYRLD